MKLAYSSLVLLLAVWSLDAASPRLPAELQRRGLGWGLGLGLVSTHAVAANNPQCHDRSRSCASCNAVNVCAYVGMGYRLISSEACPDDKPFCFNGQCQKTTPYEACGSTPPVTTDFTCIDDEEVQGYYPAPFSCGTYYVCSKGVAYVYNCPADQVYDQVSASCVRLDKNPGSCNSFNCAANVNKYLLYGPDPSVYAFCVSATSALVSKCPENYRMNPFNGLEPCRPYCSSAGRIADADVPNAYYNCLELDGGRLSAPLKEYCPPGMLFSASAKRCVQNPASQNSTETS
ncbi:uncharacterized protein LOC117647318 [Thrips palmi]|uniref:Uncharacterized protein LOC117647318 n=1 Tax=Thrips palmi TaxID=161013 RepID=A0A6P8ZBB5_THRPL|nr:uncharacterized protein LOC117647318 [Thrips palmi]